MRESGDQAGWRVLDWDSSFFGFRIARVAEERYAANAGRIIEDCARQGVRCLCFLAEAGDVATIRQLERQGFRLVDVRLTLMRELRSAEAAPDFTGIRPSRADDVPALERIARESHHDTRFYADSHFPRERCDALYATWIARSCVEGFADAVFVAETAGGQPAGYITCNLKGTGEAQIGLMAVAREARGAGVGRSLIGRALQWARSQGAVRMITVTQGNNVAAVRMYERCGFVAERRQLWYHRWFEPAAEP